VITPVFHGARRMSDIFVSISQSLIKSIVDLLSSISLLLLSDESVVKPARYLSIAVKSLLPI